MAKKALTPALAEGIAKRTKAFASKLYSLMKDKFTDDELKKIRATARAHAGGRTAADLKALARRAAAVLASDIDDDLMVDADASTGVWIALKVSPDVANQLALDEAGEPADELHLTLAYLGDVNEFTTLQLAKVVVAVEDCTRWSPPLSGVVSGVGRFDGEVGEGPSDVIYASVDMPGLTALREALVNRIRGAGATIDEKHGFDPHVTLAYVEREYATPDVQLGGIPIRFSSVCLYIGENEVEVALGGGAVYSESPSDGQEHSLSELCSLGHGSRLFIERNFSEAPEWIPFLPKPGTYVSPRYGKIVITRERNQNFIKNFSAAVYQEKLPVDAEHELSLSGACGWIVGMRMNSDGSVDGQTEWTDRGRKLVEADRFKYISPAFFDRWVDPATEEKFSDVAYGAALTTRPFFKEKSLRPLLASENGLSEGVTDGDEISFRKLETYNSGRAYNEHGQSTTAGDDTMKKCTACTDGKVDGKTCTLCNGKGEVDENKKATEAGTDAAAAGEKKFTEVELDAARKEAAETARKEAETDHAKKLTESENENKKLNDRIGSLEKTDRERRFSEQAKEFIGDVNSHVEMMEFLATDGGGEASDRFKNYVKNQKALSEQARAGKHLFKEVGADGDGTSLSGDPIEEVNAKAKAFREADSKLDEQGALAKVFRESPELYERYRDANTQKVG